MSIQSCQCCWSPVRHLWAWAQSPGPITQAPCSVWGRLLADAAAAPAGEAPVLANEVPAESARWEQNPPVVPSQSSAPFPLRSRKEEGETMSPPVTAWESCSCPSSLCAGLASCGSPTLRVAGACGARCVCCINPGY